MSPLIRSKAYEARPVGETASKVWRRGQNIQGVMPQNILGTARVCVCGSKLQGLENFSFRNNPVSFGYKRNGVVFN